jgi:hypothetical protein
MQSPEATKDLDGTLAGRLNFTRRAPSLVNDHRDRRAWPRRRVRPSAGLLVTIVPIHEQMLRQHRANELPSEWRASCAEGKGPMTASQKAVAGRIRRAKGGLNSKLRAVCVGALRRGGD